MFAQNVEEEVKLEAMQRVWQLRRGGSSSLFETVNQTEDLLALPLQANVGRNSCAAVVNHAAPVFKSCEPEIEAELFQEPIAPIRPKEPTKNYVSLNAASIGDLPAHYKISSLESHQFPVVGVFIDKRVIPGFKYRVRPLPPIGQHPSSKCLFQNRALTLKSIGRGYARRFTFEANKDELNDNDNYFWSDNRPEGYAFELEAISVGDKFTIFDGNKEPQGTVEVLKLEGPQIEIGCSANMRDGLIEKKVNGKFIGKVEFFETGVAKPMLLSGLVQCVKSKGKATAEIVKIANVVIRKQRCCLMPGIQKIHRRVTVQGAAINDVPTKYSMTGLEPYEIPVVGTYVDPRIIPGFYYKVRPNDRKDHLFNGRALKLVSIGMGYAKRLTFQPDSLVEPDNYFWSDSHPDGLGLEPKAIHKGMKFFVKAGKVILGEATVFRDDKPQIEERMEKVLSENGRPAIEKSIHVDVMCHIRLCRTGGATTENEEHLMRVYGLAVVRKESNSNEPKVIRVDNVGIDSELKVLFAQTDTELTFVPKN